MLGWQTWHRVQSRVQIREHGVVPSLYFLKGYQIRTICAPVGATAGSLTSSHAHAIDPANTLPESSISRFPATLRPIISWALSPEASSFTPMVTSSASSTYNPQTDKYLHCLSIMKAGKARLPYCKFIFPRKSRDKQCRTHSHKPGPLIKRGSPQREKQRSLSFCHSNSLPLICCSVSVSVLSINALAGRPACPPHRTLQGILHAD